MKLIIRLLYSLVIRLNKQIFGLVLLSALCFSCEKLALKETRPDNASAIFEDAWTILDERYPFFTIKKIDWNLIHDEYAQEIIENMSDRNLFDVIGNMVMELQDGHTDLHCLVNNWSTSYWPITSAYYSCFNIDVIKNNYLGGEYFAQNAVVVGKIDDIGYVYIGDFMQELSPAIAEDMMKYLEGTEQFIFDVRNNTGGSEIYGKNLIQYFVKQKVANKIMKLKNGPDHDDFISYTLHLEPGVRYVEYVKIVVLANKVTFSAGNDFVNNFSILPDVTIIGDTTGGGGSTPYYYELANGWILRYSSNIQLRPTDSLIIDSGIPPDMYVGMVESVNSDNVLNAALSFLHR